MNAVYQKTLRERQKMKEIQNRRNKNKKIFIIIICGIMGRNYVPRTSTVTRTTF